MPKNVLIIAYHYPPENAVGGFRPYRFARCLRTCGWTPAVLTAAPQVVQAGDTVRCVADRSRDLWEGRSAPATHLGVFQRYTELAVRRFLFPGALGITWAREVTREAVAQVAVGPAPIAVFSTFPPLAAHLAGWRIARRLGVPWIADFRDPFAHAPTNRLAGLHALAARGLESRFMTDAAAVIINTDSAAESYRRVYPGLADKIRVIWNGFDPADPLGPLPVPLEGPRTLVHAGSLYAGRDPGVLLASLARLRRTHDEAAADVRVLLVGPDELTPAEHRAIDTAAAEGWLKLQPRQVTQNEARRLQQQAHGLVLIQPQSEMQVPGKLFEYLRIGRPILSLAPKGSAIEQVLAGAGVPYVNVYPDDADAVVDDKLRGYLALPPEPVRASDWFEQQFNAERQTRQLADILDEVTAGRTRARPRHVR